MFSCRQLIGVVSDCTQLLQLPAVGVVFGRGYNFRNSRPPWLRRPGGITLPGNAAPVSGSIGVGDEHSGMLELKSPTRSAAVGTSALRTVPRFSRFHSCE